MSDFAEVVGTLLAGLARARGTADEETAVLAEHYRKQPLLAGMSVPRVRVPEMMVELPVIVEAHEEGGEPDSDHIAEAVLEAVRGWADGLDFTPPRTLLPTMRRELPAR